MKFDTKLIGYITIFENHTTVKDCFFRDKELVFIVKEGQLGKAVGKNGVNIKKLLSKLKHKLRVIDFDHDPVYFVKNLLYPIDNYRIEKNDNKLVTIPADNKTKGQIYGRDRSNFKWVKEVLKRHFKDVELVMG